MRLSCLARCSARLLSDLQHHYTAGGLGRPLKLFPSLHLGERLLGSPSGWAAQRILATARATASAAAWLTPSHSHRPAAARAAATMSWLRTMMHRVRTYIALPYGKAGEGLIPAPGVHRSRGTRADPPLEPASCQLWLAQAVPLQMCCLCPHDAQEPVIIWSFIIGGVGLGLPLVVPPIREAMGYGAPSPKSPPPVSTVSSAWGRAAGLFPHSCSTVGCPAAGFEAVLLA